MTTREDFEAVFTSAKAYTNETTGDYLQPYLQPYLQAWQAWKAATDAALERAAQKVEPSRGTEAIEVIGGEDGLLMLRELAAEIRALKESKE